MPAGRLDRNGSSTTYAGSTQLKASDSVKLVSMSEAILPTPVQLTPAHLAHSRRKRRKRCATDSAKGLINSAFERVQRKFGAGTAPSASSVDLDSEDAGEGNEMYGTWWGSNKKAKALEDAEEINEVVVDREWGEDFGRCGSSDPGGEKGGGYIGGMAGHSAAADQDSVGMISHKEGVGSSSRIAAFVRWTLWPPILGFFATQFVDEKSESLYRRENWFLRKVRDILFSLYPTS